MADTRGMSHGPGWWLRNADNLLAAVEHSLVTITDTADHTTGAIIEQAFFKAPVACVLTAINYTPNSGTTVGAGTVHNLGTVGARTVVVATVGVTTVLAFKPISHSLSSTATTLVAGDVLTLRRTTASSDTVQASGVMEVKYRVQYSRLDNT
jgi:hypothetical protein